MTFGLNILNDAGKIVFSTDYSALHFQAKVAGSGTTVNGRNAITASFTCIGVPIVFIQSDGNYQSVDSLVNVGGNTWVVVASSYYEFSTGATSGTFYIFSKPPTAPTAGAFGLMVYDQFGGCNLNSSQRILKVEGVGVTSTFTGSSPASGVAAGVTSLLAGQIPAAYAVSGCGFGFISAPSPIVSYFTIAGVRRYSATQFSFGRGRIVGQQNNQNIDFFAIRGGQYIIFIDTNQYQ